MDWTAVFQAQYRRLRWLLYGRTGDFHLADDAIAYAFAQAIEKRVEPQNPAGYLRTLAKHYVYKHYQNHEREQRLVAQYLRELSDHRAPTLYLPRLSTNGGVLHGEEYRLFTQEQNRRSAALRRAKQRMEQANAK